MKFSKFTKFTLSLGLAGLALAAALPASAQATSPDEANAYKAIQAMYTNPATTPDDMDTAAKDFITKYPNSVALATIEVFTMEYYRRKSDYTNLLVWGEMALKKDPGNIVALSTLAAEIPGHVHDTDIDYDQRLTEAGGYDQKLIDTFESKPEADGSYTIDGHKLPADTFTQLKSAYEGSAYSSEGRIAFNQKKYADAVTAYQKALTIEPAQQQGVDYYFLAQAQEGQQDWKGATDSLNQAAAHAGANTGLANAVQAEMTKVKKASGGGL